MKVKPGDAFGHLTVLDTYRKDRKTYCICYCNLCGKQKDIRYDSLAGGKTISCGCYKNTDLFSAKNKAIHQTEDLTGKIYAELKVLKTARVGKKTICTCQCSCGNVVDVWAANLKNGNTKTCGSIVHRQKHLEDMHKATLNDLSGKVFGDWLVLERDGNSQPTRWLCKCCSCGTIKPVIASTLISGQSTNCGCRRYNPSLEGQTIGHWLVGKRSKRKRPNGRFCTTYLCACECGTKRYVDESRLLRKSTLSCGCFNSKANEYIAQALKERGCSFSAEYSYSDLFGLNGGLLRFDFALLNEGNVVALIEYQGQQHFSDKEFGKQQREVTDKQKRKYCKQNKIPLFEIKYTDNIDQALDKIFTHITC